MNSTHRLAHLAKDFVPTLQPCQQCGFAFQRQRLLAEAVDRCSKLFDEKRAAAATDSLTLIQIQERVTRLLEEGERHKQRLALHQSWEAAKPY